MKKVIAIIIMLLMLSTAVFCIAETDPNPPMKIAPIGDTVSR